MAVAVVNPGAAEGAVLGNVRLAIRDITFDSSYPTGGEPITAAQFGMQQIIFAIASVKVAGTGSVTEVFVDTVNMKLKANAAAAEIANTTDLSAVTVRVHAFGK